MPTHRTTTDVTAPAPTPDPARTTMRPSARIAGLTAVAATLAVMFYLVGATPLYVPAAWGTTPLGTGLQLVLLAGSVVLTDRGREVVATRLAGAAAGLAGTSLILGQVFDISSVAIDGLGWVLWVLPSEESAGVHLFLALAQVSRRGDTSSLRLLRITALALGVLHPAATLTAHAYGTPDWSVLPAQSPMAPLPAVLTIAIAGAMAASYPDRWPLRGLIEHQGDRVLVRRLLPFVVAMPLLPPLLVGVARITGLPQTTAIVLGAMGPSLILVGLLVVALSDHRELMTRLGTRDRELRRTLDALPTPVLLRGADGDLLHLNPSAEALMHTFGLSREQLQQGVEVFLDAVSATDDASDPVGLADHPVIVALAEERTASCVIEAHPPTGDSVWLRIQASPVTMLDDRRGAVVSYEDITEERVRSRELHHAAAHDTLTGLANRRQLAERFDAVGRAKRHDDDPLGLVFIDLNGFKPINDIHGHEVGDRLLVEVAHRLSGAARSNDVVARVGGDEFAILCAGSLDQTKLTAIVDRLRSAVIGPAVVAGTTVDIDASLGAVLLDPTDGLDAALREADAAMYRDKTAQKAARADRRSTSLTC